MLRQWTVALLLAANAVAALAGEPDLIVTQVTGSVTMEQHRPGLLDRIRTGASVDLAPDASMVLFHPGRGQQFTLTGPARFRITGAGIERLSGTGNTRVDHPDLALARALRRPDQVVAGAVVRSSGSYGAEERVAPSRPVFRWRTRPHRGHWTFRLSDGAGRLLYETTLAHSELVLPDTVPLVPGGRYWRELQWEERNGSVRTETLPVEALSAVEDAELSALFPSPEAGPAARVLYGLYLRTLGVHGLAARVLPELSEEIRTP